jgi:hypothetical protein
MALYGTQRHSMPLLPLVSAEKSLHRAESTLAGTARKYRLNPEKQA